MPAELASAVRSLAPVLGAAGDAGVELLALVWGPRFDRAHGLALAAQLPSAPAAALHAAADRFDRLHRGQQQRLRRLLCATIAHAPHPADRR
ncbi:hypothetical protein HK414_01520 [Ramlibacter terrae]|uniref:Uncharacterized protein n=1 Tax=Ramlibacter terrae TaxID=2732511 RepID=A0ABX6NZX2_9BURK|nr:hypothetical protein HK414_01520 [Ramlibacter terrae]